MKRLTCIFAIVLGLIAITTATVVGYSDARSVTAAGKGLFGAGATLGGVALQGVELGTGVFIEADGSASDQRHRGSRRCGSEDRLDDIAGRRVYGRCRRHRVEEVRRRSA